MERAGYAAGVRDDLRWRHVASATTNCGTSSTRNEKAVPPAPPSSMDIPVVTTAGSLAGCGDRPACRRLLSPGGRHAPRHPPPPRPTPVIEFPRLSLPWAPHSRGSGPGRPHPCAAASVGAGMVVVLLAAAPRSTRLTLAGRRPCKRQCPFGGRIGPTPPPGRLRRAASSAPGAWRLRQWRRARRRWRRRQRRG